MIHVRRANVDDLDVLLPLVEAYRGFYEQVSNVERERAFMRDRLIDEAATVFLACDETGAFGFAQLFQTYSTVHLGPALLLEDLYVAPNVRRRGVATRLLDAAMDHAHQIGAVSMFLETAFGNATAQSLYERAGWIREARFAKYNAPL